MKTRSLAVGMLLISMLALTACNKPAATDTPDADKAPTEETKKDGEAMEAKEGEAMEKKDGDAMVEADVKVEGSASMEEGSK